MPLCNLGGGAGVKDPSAKKDKKIASEEAEEEEPETYYDAMKKEMGGRLARTRAALDALDEQQRLAMEGHRPGAYLRLSFTGAANTNVLMLHACISKLSQHMSTSTLCWTLLTSSSAWSWRAIVRGRTSTPASQMAHVSSLFIF